VGEKKEKRGEIRIISWNVGAMTGKDMEVVEVVKKKGGDCMRLGNQVEGKEGQIVGTGI
jgi:hypothetical protein